mmetsp:Transcript_27035/g.59473  ORF Transcript_27035/g.59473 Transcript_27035/m.59473 type:complete len:365 (+) Transcript_27035:439-1533(+)
MRLSSSSGSAGPFSKSAQQPRSEALDAAELDERPPEEAAEGCLRSRTGVTARSSRASCRGRRSRLARDPDGVATSACSAVALVPRTSGALLSSSQRSCSTFSCSWFLWRRDSAASARSFSASSRSPSIFAMSDFRSARCASSSSAQIVPRSCLVPEAAALVCVLIAFFGLALGRGVRGVRGMGSVCEDSALEAARPGPACTSIAEESGGTPAPRQAPQGTSAVWQLDSSTRTPACTPASSSGGASVWVPATAEGVGALRREAFEARASASRTAASSSWQRLFQAAQRAQSAPLAVEARRPTRMALAETRRSGPPSPLRVQACDSRLRQPRPPPAGPFSGEDAQPSAAAMAGEEGGPALLSPAAA